MAKIKILHVMTKVDVGGISSLIYNYYNHMRKDIVVFHIVAIETTYEQGYQDIFERMGMRVFFMPETISHRLIYLWQLIRNEKYDVVHSHVELISAVYLSVALLAGTKTRIAHTHLSVDNEGVKSKLLQTLLSGVATHRVGCSRVAIQKLFGTKYLNRSTVISNAIDPSKYVFNPNVRTQTRQEMGIGDTYVVGFVGRLTALKNLSYLLDVFKALKDLEEKVTLLIVGDGELREEMVASVARLELTDHVKFLGNRSDVNYLMMVMDVLLLPSFSEGLGLVMIEAQAASLKCIGSSGRVPQETCISADYALYEAIEKPATVWANRILGECVGYERKNMTAEIRRKHFDVRTEANKLVEFYNNAVYGQ